MGDSNTIVINTNPIKKVTFSLKGKEYEVPAYMSIHDLQLFSTEKKETKKYKRAISAVISEKINANGKVTDIEEIYKQDDIFFSEFITAIVENNECIEKIYADTSTELSEIERFGVAYDEYIRGMAERMADAMKPIAESYSQLVKNIDFSGAITSFQESMKRIGKIASESVSGITNAAKIIASSMEPLLRLMHLMYKRACLSLHASCMGNRIRLGSDCTGIDMGPWENGQENAPFLSTASLIYIVSVTYQVLDIDGADVNKKLNELTMYYHKIIEERAKKQ